MKNDVIKTPTEISKELEIINFRALVLKYPQQSNRRDDFINVINKGIKKNNLLKNNQVSPQTIKSKKTIGPRTQLESFQQAMRLLFITGQTLGLNPAKGILETNIEKVRFSVFSWRFLYCFFIGVAQTAISAICLFRLLKGVFDIPALGYLSFYSSACVTTLLFIQVGYKWQKLLKDILECNLDEYIDPRIKFKCYTATVVFITLALIEHFLSIIHKIEHIYSCHPNLDIYDKFLKDQFPWFFEMNIQRTVTAGVILQILNLVSTVNWNYPDLFIICISIYLASILEQLNEKIITASTKHYLPPSYWRVLREDYNRATRLVRSFDDVISGIIFTSFASNLFFICLQLFHILAHGVEKSVSSFCANHLKGPFYGHVYTIYLLFSTIYLFARSLTVSLEAARVNTASLVPAPALYNIPSSAYCDEVARFISQVNEDNIALSGLQFFFITRELVLTVAGTIVTYELVLLQFSKDNIVKTN